MRERSDFVVGHDLARNCFVVVAASSVTNSLRKTLDRTHDAARQHGSQKCGKKNDRNHRDRGKEPHLLLGFLKAFLIAHDHEGVSLPLRAERKDGRRFGHLRISFGKGFITLGNRLHAGIRIVAVHLHRERHANGSALVEFLNQGVIYIGQIFAGKRRFCVFEGIFHGPSAHDCHA